MCRTVLFIMLFIMLPMNPAQAQDGRWAHLTVRIEGIKNYSGEVGAALFNEAKGYPVGIQHSYLAEWVKASEGQDVIEIVFDEIPAGEYAVSVMHDENGNRKLETSFLGFPREGVGFSNGQKVVMSAPKYTKAAFMLAEGEDQHITIVMDYSRRLEK